jgi:hypothetical protein
LSDELYPTEQLEMPFPMTPSYTVHPLLFGTGGPYTVVEICQQFVVNDSVKNGMKASRQHGDSVENAPEAIRQENVTSIR